MSAFRLLVTGSRLWSDTVPFRQEMDAYALAAVGAGHTSLVVVHGACYPKADQHTGRRPHVSADWLAHLWVVHAPHPPGLLVTGEKPHPADWTAACQPTCRPGHRRIQGGRSICPAAGNYRNQIMVDCGADQGIAFPLDRSTGTRDCVARMRWAGIPVRVVEPRLHPTGDTR